MRGKPEPMISGVVPCKCDDCQHEEPWCSACGSLMLIKQQLMLIEQALAESIIDAQDKAEDEGFYSAGFFTGDNDDIPVCVPEDAAPELDSARTHVQEAIDDINELTGAKS